MSQGRGGAAAPPLTADAEAALWEACRTDGSLPARDQLFSNYLPFAQSLARRQFLDRRGGDIEFADLYQLACAGLLEAIDHFDPGRGVPFTGFAARRVTGSIVDGVAKMSEVREQISYRNRMRYERARSMSPGQVEALSPSAALDELIELALGLALGFILEGTALYVSEGQADRQANAYDSLVWRDTLRRALAEVAGLPPREQAILRRHYFDGLGFEQIGDLLGISKGRVSQIHRAALLLLKKRLINFDDFKLRR